jgi:hypothetical protein
MPVIGCDSSPPALMAMARNGFVRGGGDVGFSLNAYCYSEFLSLLRAIPLRCVETASEIDAEQYFRPRGTMHA